MKKIILLALLLFTCGCDVEYTLSVGDVYSESTKFYYDDDYEEFGITNIMSYNDDVGYSEDNEQIDGISYYEITEESYYYIYSFEFTDEKYIYSNIATTCYSLYKVLDEETLKLYTNNVNGCFSFYDNLETLTINIIDENNKFITTNATNVADNVYTWYFTQDDKYDAYIEINIDTTVTDEEENNLEAENSENEFDSDLTDEEEIISDENKNVVYITLIIFLSVTIGILVYTVKKSKVK